MNKSDLLFNEFESLIKDRKDKEAKQLFMKSKQYFHQYAVRIAFLCIGNNNKFINILKELNNIKSLMYLDSFNINFEEELEVIKKSTLKELELYLDVIEKHEQVIDIIFKLNDNDKKELILIKYRNKLYLSQYILNNNLEKYYYIVRSNLREQDKTSSYVITRYFLEHLIDNINEEIIRDLFQEINIYECKNIDELYFLFFNQDITLKNIFLLEKEYEKNKERLIGLLSRLIRKKNNYMLKITIDEKIKELEEVLNFKIILDNF